MVPDVLSCLVLYVCFCRIFIRYIINFLQLSSFELLLNRQNEVYDVFLFDEPAKGCKWKIAEPVKLRSQRKKKVSACRLLSEEAAAVEPPVWPITGGEQELLEWAAWPCLCPWSLAL